MTDTISDPIQIQTTGIADDSTGAQGAAAINAAGQATQQAPATQAPSAAPPSQQTLGVQTFEDVQVGSVATKISGATTVDTFGHVVGLDDRVRVVGEFRVVKVNHTIAKDGSVVREQVLTPCGDLTLVPFNHMDPNDVGIVRARP